MMIKNTNIDKITTYSYGTNIFKICENEMLLKNKFDDKLDNEAQVPKNNSKAITNELHELINESQALRNNSQVTRNEAQALRNNPKAIRDESNELRNEVQVIKNNS